MNDVFISYAHIDNQALTEGQKGWITKFHDSLKARLGQRLGRAPEIWRDLKLEGTDNFGDAIVHQLPGAKAFISIISPRYINSEWCIREVEEFCKHAESRGGVQVNNKSRIIKVVKTPVKEHEVPVPLNHFYSTQLGFEFFEANEDTGRAREFNDEFGEEAKLKFVLRVDDLAGELAELVQMQGSPTQKSDKTESTLSGKTVYLATSTSDVQAECDQIRRELKERGAIVVPDSPLSTVGEEFENMVQEHLRGSHLAIHPIGSRYGLVPEDRVASVLELQNRLAAERCVDADFSRIIWIPRGLEPSDDRQKAFVLKLFEDAEAQKGAEILEDSVEKLKGLMLDKLAPPPKTEPSFVSSPDTGAPLVYLVCDQQDEESVDPIEDYLYDQGLEVSRPRFDGDPEEIQTAHRQALLACDAVLIYYGEGSRTWVDMKLLDLKQAPGYGRDKPFAATTVCIAPPDDRQKKRFRTHSADIIRLPESFSSDPLQPFVKRLFESRGDAAN